MRNSRRDSIEHHMSYCQHYDARALISKRDAACKAGVVYRDNFGPEFGIIQRMPCIDGQVKYPDPCTVCPKWVRVTEEQAAIEAAEFDAAIARITVAMPFINAWKKAHEKGAAEVVECPICKGRLHMSKSSYNGHIHAKCETPDCVFVMQ